MVLCPGGCGKTISASHLAPHLAGTKGSVQCPGGVNYYNRYGYHEACRVLFNDSPGIAPRKWKYYPGGERRLLGDHHIASVSCSVFSRNLLRLPRHRQKQEASLQQIGR